MMDALRGSAGLGPATLAASSSSGRLPVAHSRASAPALLQTVGIVEEGDDEEEEENDVVDEEEESDDEEVKNQQKQSFLDGHGLFTDYVVRHIDGKHPLLRVLLGGHRERRRMQSCAESSQEGLMLLRSFEDAMNLVHFERLQSDLVRLLTYFWKGQKHPAWALKPDTWRSLARRICLQKTMDRCHTAELQEYFQRREEEKALQIQEICDGHHEHEDGAAHSRRLKSFWDTFHRGNRKGETRPLTPQKTELCIPAPNGAGWVQPPKPRTGRAGSKARKGSKERSAPQPVQAQTSKSSQQPWVEGLEHKRLGMTDMNWKFRAARGPISRSRLRIDAGNESKGRARLGDSASAGELRASPKSDSTSSWPSPAMAQRNERMLTVVTSEEAEVSPEESPSRAMLPSPTDLDGKTWWWQAGKAELTGPFQKKLKVASALGKKCASLPELTGNGSAKSKGRAGDPHTLLFRKPGTGEQPLSPSRAVSRAASSRPVSRVEKKKFPVLPPIQRAVVPPHGRSGNVEPLGPQALASPAKRYIHACQRESVVPMPISFVTGHSGKVDAVGKAWTDADLMAICGVGQTAKVEDVDLSGSTLLSDRALGAFVDVLLEDRTLDALRRINLSNCCQAGRATQEGLVRLVGESGAVYLRTLNLSGVPISMRLMFPFCEAVEKHSYLHTLNFANTGLGNAINVKQCIQKLCSSTTVEVLDLGWNCFRTEELRYLGESLTEKKTVKTLGLANCAASSNINHSISPCVYFIEQLTRDRCLQSLDISMNRIDFRGALIIEDALENSRELTTLNVSHNPFGVMGLRCLLRLLARNGCGLISITMENSYSGDLLPSVEGIQTFTYTNPGGHYTLNLERPYHRSLLRTLYKLGDTLKLTPADTFLEVSYQPGSFSHPSSKDANGVFPVPNSGMLEFSFSIEKAMEKAVQGVKEDNFSHVLARYNEVMRFTPHFRKLIPLLAQWRSLEGSSKDQAAMLAALGRDFIFTATQINQLCKCRSMVGTTVARLMPTLTGGAFARTLVIKSVDNMGEFIKMLTLCKEYVLFNPESPTGHYRLDLSNTASGYVAQALALLDRWESGIAKRKELTDISENGDYSCVRNVMYAHQSLSLDASKPRSFDQWVIPEKEILELDYVTHLRPDCKGAVLDEDSFIKFMGILEQAECDGRTVIQVTRLVAHHINLSSPQMRRLLGIYKTSELRADALVCTFFRIIDIHNEKVFRVRYEEQSELDKLRDRLGYLVFFTYIQPEQTTYDLNFAKYDQRLAANIILSMGASEKRDNIANYRYTLPDGTVDLMPQGLPRSWDKFTAMPKEGVFRFSYKCSPEDRNFKMRMNMLQTYGRWKVEVAEEDVMWWAAPNEAPEDVVEFVFWLRSKFENTAKAFAAFDGPDGNGVISIREFEEGMKRLKCRKFKGKDEKQRWSTIFRYLDPSGEGQVSKMEFLTLDQFWEEVKTSIVEFLEWSHRAFGHDIQTLWNALDEDQSGSIQRDEWEESLDKVGYFGPSGPIFSYVDEDDEGSISWDEFEALNTFQAMYMQSVPKE
eukprot:gb/GFBE01081375.1/.p1 GENE.gb/GFBE01081375.1/~~gb/GFBE01081375.1/.p1  ORF type:complete len:1536 (+),score=380.10 gb/GFBE01081375.1/:1-4608(+)